jgi:uncharacterized protein YraI
MKPFKLMRALVITGTGLAFSTVSALAFDAVAVSAVNVRTGPSTSYARVDTLRGGEPVTITECQARWCYVEHDGPDGWVSARYLAASDAPVDGASVEDSGTGATGSGDAAATAAAAAVIGAILGGAIARRSHTTPTPAPLPYGPDTCRDGYVWRDAIPGDHVCVRPAQRTAAAHENAVAGARVDPAGAYGPNTCIAGFVWREAYRGDKTCVTGARRTQVRNENIAGPSHRVRP